MMKIIKIVSLVLFIAPMFVNASIVIDGKLDEEEWVDAQTIDDFFVINPFSLEKPDLNTKVLIHSDDSGIYFGFINSQPPETRDRRKHGRDGLRQNHDRNVVVVDLDNTGNTCLLYTSPSPRDATLSRMPSSA